MPVVEHALMSVPEAIRDQVARACAVIEQHLGQCLHAIHLYGSAVAGGLRPCSDVDLLVTIRESLSGDTRGALMMALLDVSAAPGSGRLRALEVTVVVHGDVVPWKYPARRELQFGEWLREAIQAGRFEPAQLDHDLALLLVQARQRSIALLGEAAADVFDPVPLDDVRKALTDTLKLWNSPVDWQGDARNVILTLARIWYTAATASITTKDDAASWVEYRVPAEYARLISKCRNGYLHGDAGSIADAQVGSLIHHLKSQIQDVLSWSAGSRPMAVGSDAPREMR